MTHTLSPSDPHTHPRTRPSRARRPQQHASATFAVHNCTMTLDKKRMRPLEPDFARFNGTNTQALQDSNKISKLLGHGLLEQSMP